MPPARPCRHLFTNGHQCGSPALRGEELCFYHHSTRRPLKTQVLHGHQTRAVLPVPLDLHAIQRGLAELLRLTAAELLDLSLASQLHRQLATASQNLARIERADARAEARAQALNLDRTPVTDYTNHPVLGTIAPAQPEVQTPVPSVQTQAQQNEDFETSHKTYTKTPDNWELPTENSPKTTDNSELPNGNLPEPLPDPIARFTLPPEPDFPESKAALAAAEQAYADAYNKLAQGIHNRAEARAQLHDSLFPLQDAQVRQEDEDDIEHDYDVSSRVEALQRQEERTAA